MSRPIQYLIVLVVLLAGQAPRIAHAQEITNPAEKQKLIANARALIRDSRAMGGFDCVARSEALARWCAGSGHARSGRGKARPAIFQIHFLGATVRATYSANAVHGPLPATVDIAARDLLYDSDAKDLATLHDRLAMSGYRFMDQTHSKDRDSRP